MKYNLAKIMLRAWKLYRKNCELSFAEALHRSWISAKAADENEKRIREIKKICKAAGIAPFTAHAFRDTFATRAIESGMNPKTLQEILGHADISITMNLYCHVMEDTKVRQMNNINIAI